MYKFGLKSRLFMLATVGVVTGCGGGGGDGDGGANSPQFPVQAATNKCAALAGLTYGPATVSSATLVAATSSMPEHCKVDGFKIGRPMFQMSVLLPTVWTGGMVQGGGGGFDGFIFPGPIWNASHPLQQGAVWAASNGGHDDLTGAKLADPETFRDYSYASVGTTYDFTQALTQGYYTAKPNHNYFIGCSKGGQEALAAAAYYPQNYDGVIAQAPASNASGFVARIGLLSALPKVSDERWALLNTKRIAQCDAADGLADGVVSNTAACNPDPLTLVDWSSDERKTVGSLMSDLTLNDGTVVDQARGYGTYSDYTTYGLQWMTNVIATDEPGYDGSKFEINRYWPKIKSKTGSVLLDVDPGLLANYLKQGKKLLVYMGENDTALSVAGTKQYQTKVIAGAGSSAANTQLRFFPGVGHCGATDQSANLGAGNTEMIGELRNWVEKGTPPAELVASRVSAAGNVEMTRPICLSGTHARYNGIGDVTKAASFKCVQDGT